MSKSMENEREGVPSRASPARLCPLCGIGVDVDGHCPECGVDGALSRTEARANLIAGALAQQAAAEEKQAAARRAEEEAPVKTTKLGHHAALPLVGLLIGFAGLAFSSYYVYLLLTDPPLMD